MNKQERMAFNAENVAEFRRSGGRLSSFGDAPVLLLTTEGAKSGAARTSPMMYLADEEDADRVFVFASAAGADHNPSWFENLVAHPNALTVEIGADTLSAAAEVLPEAQRARTFAVQAGRYPRFARYQQATTRPIPVAALTLHRGAQMNGPTPTDRPPAVHAALDVDNDVPAQSFTYHVQSTATVLRDGFPYFAHHDSVSALWAKKWRGPCAAGIYPFVDGDVEDFDPIFAELISISGDDPTILSRPDDYAKPFFPVAERLVGQAEDSLRAGDRQLARELFHRAAAVYRIARFPINRSLLSQQAWLQGKAAYERGGELLDPPSVAIDIPFTAADPSAGDAGTVIPGYLRLPPGSPPEDGWPVLLFICGLDAYKTDNTKRIQQHNDAGLATVMFEIPGTGDCPAAPDDPTSADRLMTSILDWVGAEASTCGLDPTTVVVRGISTGGYYAFRVAHTHAERLVAVVAQGGASHHMFDADWIGAQNQMEYPFALADALAYKFGFRDADIATSVRRYAEGAHVFSLLDSGVVDLPSCRLLALNGMEDSIFPIEDNFLVATRGVGKDLLARGNVSHMGNPGGEEISVTWLSQALASRSA